MLMSIASKSAFAYDIVVRNDDGEAIYNIYYNFFYSNEGKELEVTYESFSDSKSHGYENITKIKIPETIKIDGNVIKVTSISDDAFRSCSRLTSVCIPNSVTSIGSRAFQNCSGLTSLIIGKSVKYIGSSAFSGCSGLTSVTIPNSVTNIGKSAFENCSGLTSVTIPNSVTSIGRAAFYSCSGLTSVTIPNSVTSIDSGAFNFTNSNNDLLVEIISLIENPTKDTGSSFSKAIYNNATLYVPVGTMAKYKQTEGWKKFVWIEEGIPTGIAPVKQEKIVGEECRYDLNGNRVKGLRRGVNIVKTSDGKTRKVVVK